MSLSLSFYLLSDLIIKELSKFVHAYDSLFLHAKECQIELAI